jgi:hypothetical protein
LWLEFVCNKFNFNEENAIYLQVLAKGLVLFADEQIVESPIPTTTTFALPIDTNMAPGFRMLVYHVTLHAELVADSIFVPVTGFNGYEVRQSLIMYYSSVVSSCTRTECSEA